MTTTTLLPLALTERRTRGYKFITAEILKSTPALYATDEQGYDAIVKIHYFIGGADWFITELDPETFDAFGWCDLGHGYGGELGYVNLLELANVRAGWQAVDRDLYWEPCTLTEAIESRGARA